MESDREARPRAASTGADEASVTVLLPAYNGAAFIEGAIDSVKHQTLETWRLVVVDDGSTDDTLAIAERLAVEDSRISVFSHANGGVAAARNVGLALARTKWVALLDQDDQFLPVKLERQLGFLAGNPDVKCLGTWGYRVGSRGRRLGSFDVGPTSREEFSRLRSANRLVYLLAASVVFDRELALKLGAFRSERGGTDDIELWNRMADCDTVLALPERLVRYRVHSGSESSARLHEQRMNTVRIGVNVRRRREGLPEIDWARFLACWEQQPVSERRQQVRTSQCLALYRYAGALLADRNPVGLWYLIRSFLLRPTLVVRRVVRQVFPWQHAMRTEAPSGRSGGTEPVDGSL